MPQMGEMDGATSVGQAKVTLVNTGVLFLVSVGCYIRSIRNPLLYDDPVLLSNSDVNGQAPLLGLFTNDFWGQSLWHPRSHKSHRPLTVLLLRLVHCISGPSPVCFHALNIVLHFCATCLVYWICIAVAEEPPDDHHQGGLRRTRHRTRHRALLAALLFAAHPVHVDAVMQMAGTAEILCTIFMLLIFVDRIAISGRRFSLYSAVIPGVLCTFAMLSKEQGVTAVPVTIGFVGLRNVLRSTRIWQGSLWYKGLGHLVGQGLHGQGSILCAGLFLVALKLWLLSGAAPEYGPLQNPASHNPSFLTRALSGNQAVGQHALLLLWPHKLAVDWSYGSVPLITSLADPRNLLPVALYAALALIVLRVLFWHPRQHCASQAGEDNSSVALASSSSRREFPSRRTGASDRFFVLAALVWLVVPFLPASNLLFPVGFILAERVLYAPSVGFCMLLAHAITLLDKDRDTHHRHQQYSGSVSHLRQACGSVSGALFLVILALYSGRSVLHCADFASGVTLYESGVKYQPRGANMRYYLGTEFFEANINDVAEMHYKLALELLPTHAEVLTNMGVIRHRQGRFGEAEEFFRSAIAVQPRHRHHRENLAILLATANPPRLEEALALFEDEEDVHETTYSFTNGPYSSSGGDETREVDVLDYVRKELEMQKRRQSGGSGLSCDPMTGSACSHMHTSAAGTEEGAVSSHPDAGADPCKLRILGTVLERGVEEEQGRGRIDVVAVSVLVRLSGSYPHGDEPASLCVLLGSSLLRCVTGAENGVPTGRGTSRVRVQISVDAVQKQKLTCALTHRQSGDTYCSADEILSRATPTIVPVSAALLDGHSRRVLAHTFDESSPQISCTLPPPLPTELQVSGSTSATADGTGDGGGDVIAHRIDPCVAVLLQLVSSSDSTAGSFPPECMK